MKLTILVGCFNERRTILKAIEQAKSITIDKEIFVIYNCSTDGTREILKDLENDKGLKIILHSKNMGTGYSACECIQLAQGDYYYAPGADLEYKIEDVYRMIDEMESKKLDAVFGSRLADRKGISMWAFIKERPFWLGTIIATFLINLLYRKNFTDIIATKLIKIDVLRKVNCRNCNHDREFELVGRLCKGKYKISEIPVWYKPRTHKEGKTIKVMDMIPALITIFKVKFLE